MRLCFLILFFACILCGKAWAQPRTHPLAWEVNSSSNLRTQAGPPHVNTLKLPYLYDFSSRYLQIDYITNGTSVIVYTLRPHGLLSGDSIDISGAKPLINVSGLKFVKKITDYSFQLYEDKALSSATISPPVPPTNVIDYLRISKRGAKETVIPDTLAFYYNQGGVEINPGSGKNQPSYYVARFDGLKENGEPYKTFDPNTIGSAPVGYTDSLRSQPFDFSMYTAANSIYMSFYYQHGGYGEEPDISTDRLYLEFLDNTNTWNTVSTLGANYKNPDSFYVEMVPVNEAQYFHNNFQYRFRSYGQQAGSYDVWNIDYIYININRTATDTTLFDFAIRNGDDTFLRGYRAMPFNHFFTSNYDTTIYFERILSSIVTNQKAFSKPKAIQISIIDQDQNSVSTITSETDIDILKEQTYQDTLIAVHFPVRNKPQYIDLSYALEDDQRTDNTTDQFDLMFNNIITKRTYLYDYYAYDDSEAEVAFGTKQAGTRFAYQFVSAIKDTLTHIDICFARSQGLGLENSQIYLMVWKNNVMDPNPYSQPIAIHYKGIANGFFRYELNTPIYLDSAQKFFIGYKQNIPSYLYVGYDRNNDSRAKTFYNEGNEWIQMSTDPFIAEGSMMMRPVFYKEASGVPLAVRPSEDLIKNGLLLYPNPASTSINVLSTEDVSDLHYTMYSLHGQIVASGIITSTDYTLTISSLSTGMYLIQCTDAQGRIYTTRFIKE